MHSIVSQRRDLISGLLVFLTGIGATFEGLQYPLGTLASIGPGMFPTGIGVLLALTGLVLTASSVRTRNADNDPAIDWRGWGCIIAGLLAFAILGVYGGLIPAVFALVFISALGDRSNSVLQAATLAAAMAAIGVVVFWWALQLQMPLFTWG